MISVEDELSNLVWHDEERKDHKPWRFGALLDDFSLRQWS